MGGIRNGFRAFAQDLQTDSRLPEKTAWDFEKLLLDSRTHHKEVRLGMKLRCPVKGHANGRMQGTTS